MFPPDFILFLPASLALTSLRCALPVLANKLRCNGTKSGVRVHSLFRLSLPSPSLNIPDSDPRLLAHLLTLNALPGSGRTALLMQLGRPWVIPAISFRKLAENGCFGDISHSHTITAKCPAAVWLTPARRVRWTVALSAQKSFPDTGLARTKDTLIIYTTKLLLFLHCFP